MNTSKNAKRELHYESAYIGACKQKRVQSCEPSSHLLGALKVMAFDIRNLFSECYFASQSQGMFCNLL